MDLKELQKELALPIPFTVKAAMEAIGDLRKWIGNRKSESELRLLQEEKEQLKQFMAEDRSLAADRAASKGEMLLRLRWSNGPVGWDQVLASIGISRRTYQNLAALHLFARRSPELFEKFKRLGPTKLYRLARLTEDALEKLQLESEVPTERGMVKVRNLTDREMEAHLRKINPPKIRTTHQKLCSASISMRRMIENLPKDAPRRDLETIRDVLRDVSSRIMDLLA